LSLWLKKEALKKLFTDLFHNISYNFMTKSVSYAEFLLIIRINSRLIIGYYGALTSTIIPKT